MSSAISHDRSVAALLRNVKLALNGLELRLRVRVPLADELVSGLKTGVVGFRFSSSCSFGSQLRSELLDAGLGDAAFACAVLHVDLVLDGGERQRAFESRILCLVGGELRVGVFDVRLVRGGDSVSSSCRGCDTILQPRDPRLEYRSPLFMTPLRCSQLIGMHPASGIQLGGLRLEPFCSSLRLPLTVGDVNVVLGGREFEGALESGVLRLVFLTLVLEDGDVDGMGSDGSFTLVVSLPKAVLETFVLLHEEEYPVFIASLHCSELSEVGLAGDLQLLALLLVCALLRLLDYSHANSDLCPRASNTIPAGTVAALGPLSNIF